MEGTNTSASPAGQPCSTEACPHSAAYKTRSKPAWCADCIDDMLREGGLAAVEPFTGPKDWRLTTCLECGVQAHYRFIYTLEKNAVGEKTCRACYWTEWAKSARGMSGDAGPSRTYSREEILAHLDKNGYDFIATTVEINDGNDPIIARCRSCGRISAERMGDIGWGCSCSRNTRSVYPTDTGTGRVLLAESGCAALDWWDSELNDEKTFRTVTVRATRKCRWRCPDCGHRFKAQVNEMTSLRPSCPKCSAARRAEWEEEYERWKVTPVADVPELAAAWADDDDPHDVMVADPDLRRFRCPAGHHPRVASLRFLEWGCPNCRAAETRKTQQNWLADTLPEIASQWHPTLNGKLTPHNVVWDSKHKVWWRAACCGHEWPATPRDRDKYDRLRCPKCRTILGSLAWKDPALAAEWSPANPLSAWHVRPHADLPFLPEWICATNPAHVWQSSLSGRSNGAECRECQVVGKSKVELAHFAAAKEIFTGVRSGAILRAEAFTIRRSWEADIIADVDGGTLVIEYDGAHWHASAAQVLIDERKNADFLAAGYLVVRLREDDLPSLSAGHPHYREIRVYSAAPQPQAVMVEIRKWLTGLEPLE